MDVEEFSSKIGSVKLAPLEFHSLDEPLILTNHLGIKYSAFALAWTKVKDSPEDAYVYALAIYPKIGVGYQLAVLRQFGCPSTDTPWYDGAEWFFKAWVQDWLKSHLNFVINGAIRASRIKWI